jgi:hypothetical protein
VILFTVQAEQKGTPTGSAIDQHLLPQADLPVLIQLFDRHRCGMTGRNSQRKR